MTLVHKQWLFSRFVCQLLKWLSENSYEVTFGETWRTKEQAELNAKTGDGIVNSLHCLRLAIDLNIWKDGTWLRKTEDYAAIGEYWESLSTPEIVCCWGGRFHDGNHFSIEHNGVR